MPPARAATLSPVGRHRKHLHPAARAHHQQPPGGVQSEAAWVGADGHVLVRVRVSVRVRVRVRVGVGVRVRVEV